MTRRSAITLVIAVALSAALAIAFLSPRLESGPYVTAVSLDGATVLHVVSGRILSKRTGPLGPGELVVASAPGGGSVSFQAPRPPGAAFTFCAIGDSGVTREHDADPDPAAIQRRIGATMLASSPDFIMHTGDVAYYHSERRKYGPQFFEPFGPLLARAAFFPTPGNHDVRRELGSPYFELFPTGGPDPRFYSFDWGGVHFVSLDGSDDELPETHPQYSWLERDLAAAASASARVVFQHFPIHVSTDSRLATSPSARHLLPLLKRHRVGLFVSGHHHLYERTKPIDGTTYVITGGGGGVLLPQLPEGPAAFSACAASRYHFVRFSVEAGGSAAGLEAVSPEGEVFDRARVEWR